MLCLFLSYKQLAARWGVAVQTLRIWYMEGRLPGAVKFGRLVRFPVSYILQLEANGTCQ